MQSGGNFRSHCCSSWTACSADVPRYVHPPAAGTRTARRTCRWCRPLRRRSAGSWKRLLPSAAAAASSLSRTDIGPGAAQSTGRAAHPAASCTATTPGRGPRSGGCPTGSLLLTGGAGTGEMHTAAQPQTSAGRSGHTSGSACTTTTHSSQQSGFALRLRWRQDRRVRRRRRQWLMQTLSACCGGRQSLGCRCRRRRQRSPRSHQSPQQPPLPAQPANPPAELSRSAQARDAAAAGVRWRRRLASPVNPARHLNPCSRGSCGRLSRSRRRRRNPLP